jgi:hypothetical protein
MAQWAYGYSGHTHDTKILDIEASLRLAVASHSAASEEQRELKATAVRHLAERLLAARLKAVRARIARLREPDLARRKDQLLTTLLRRENELASEQVAGILREFGFDFKPEG